MISKYFFMLVIVLYFSIAAFSQGPKQTNTTGSELYADAPYQLFTFNQNGQLNSLPISFYIHDSNSGTYNNELAYINIRLKNALSSSFSDIILFNDISDSAFMTLFSHYSPHSLTAESQGFVEAKPKSSANHSIIFTCDTNWGVPNTPIVDITRRYFYFTCNLPASKFSTLGNIFDVEITFGLDWEEDQKVYLRVFKTENTLPVLNNWYRGDVHYHGMYTQNSAEMGLPLAQTAYNAKMLGLQWLVFTDHSCDFDNYGTSMQQNWAELGNTCDSLNIIDSNLILIRGIEMSVKNSQGKIVHALSYPSPDSIYSLPYIGDGGGDTQTTAITIDMLSDSLLKYGGFMYAAHPFAELDALSFAISGGLWNLGDICFPLNGEAFPSAGTVGCNDLAYISDVFSITDSLLFKPTLVGGQNWNLCNTLETTGDINNPWNIAGAAGEGFTMLQNDNSIMHLFRLSQNMDVQKAIWAKSLLLKNQNSELKNWKYFISGGTDAHGSFNYSNTDMFQNVSGNINDNALGKINTYTYCPNGMGQGGKNVLNALKNGNTIISNGPLLCLEVECNDGLHLVPGNDTIMSTSEMSQAMVKLQLATSPEFGSPSWIGIFVGTQWGEYEVSVPVFSEVTEMTLLSILQSVPVFDSLSASWFYLRAQLVNTRIFGPSEIQFHKKSFEFFHCYTNPVWVKCDLITSSGLISQNESFSLYPNPAKTEITITPAEQVKIIYIYDLQGRLVCEPELSKEGKVYISSLEKGYYVAKIFNINGLTSLCRFVKY